MTTLSRVWDTIQKDLFPSLNSELGELSEREKQFVSVVELLPLEKMLFSFQGNGKGRPPASRISLAKCFIAKSIYNLEQTKAFLDLITGSPSLRRLCGFETVGTIPSNSTFSRAFDDFSDSMFPQELHQALIKTNLSDKLFGHNSRDSSAIEAREKPIRNIEIRKPNLRRGRPPKWVEPPKKEPTRLELQPGRTLEQNIIDLPAFCNVGTKVDSKGHKTSWIGYKLHIDAVDGTIPVSCILSSASLHDSQVAIPLAQMTHERVKHCYDLMDSAYDAPAIRNFSSTLGHVPLIDSNPRRSGQKRKFDPAEQIRFNERTNVERVFSNLKDRFGIRQVWVRGAKKVMAHLMFAVVSFTALQIYKLL